MRFLWRHSSPPFPSPFPSPYAACLEAAHLAQRRDLVRAPAELDLVVPDHHRRFVRHRALHVLEHRLRMHLGRRDHQGRYTPPSKARV